VVIRIAFASTALAGLAVAGCGDGTVVLAPVIDSPPPGSDAAAFPDLDEVELSIAFEGNPDDLVSATFSRGEPLELRDVPYGDDLVIHMIGRRSGSEVAAGRTGAFDLHPHEPAPAPHLDFARTVLWAEAAAPATPVRIDGAAITYADDGSGVFLGGSDNVNAPIAGVDRFDPRAGTFTQLGPVAPRRGAVVAQLDGPLVVAGGLDAVSGTLATFIELVTLDRIDRVEVSGLTVTEHAIATLVDGRAVVFGGNDLSATPVGAVVEIAPDGALATVREVATLAVPREGHTATRLSNDLGAPVVIAGGSDAGAVPIAIAELYLPLREAFADPADFAPTMVVPRRDHQAIRLPDGSVLFIGGVDLTGMPVPTLELFSIESGFKAVGMLPGTAGVTRQSVTPLPDGRVLIAGGLDTNGTPVDTAFIVRLDPLDGIVDIVATDHLMTPRAGHQATLLCDGTVMLAGGTQQPTPSERYNPPAIGRR
jgi:hypothetical protein